MQHISGHELAVVLYLKTEDKGVHILIGEERWFESDLYTTHQRSVYAAPERPRPRLITHINGARKGCKTCGYYIYPHTFKRTLIVIHALKAKYTHKPQKYASVGQALNTRKNQTLQLRYTCTCSEKGAQMDVQARILANGDILGLLGTDTQSLLIKSQTAPRHHLLLLPCGHVVST